MSEITVTGFQISTMGDPSVGIPYDIWELHGEFYFNDKEELEDFKKGLEDFFANYYSDERPGVISFEEAKEIEETERKMYEEQRKAEEEMEEFENERKNNKDLEKYF